MMKRKKKHDRIFSLSSLVSVCVCVCVKATQYHSSSMCDNTSIRALSVTHDITHCGAQVENEMMCVRCVVCARMNDMHQLDRTGGKLRRMFSDVCYVLSCVDR